MTSRSTIIERQTAASNDDGVPAIRITDLAKTFRRKGGELVPAVDRVSLDISKGEMVVLLGPSGCGKTSLLRCIGGLEEPDGGQISLSGRHVAGAGKKSVPPELRNIGMMFQSYALWPHMTVAKNVSYPLEARQVPRDEATQRVKRMLELAGISGLAEQHPGNLSGGQQQRVALVRSLVAEPEVILFDEPLSNVDARVRGQLRAEIRSMQERLGFAGIYVTHDQEEAMQLADRIAVMRAGKVVEIGAPDDLYNRPHSRYVAEFLGELNHVHTKPARSYGEFAGAEHPVLGTVSFAGDAGADAPSDATLSLGFRPERVRLSTDPQKRPALNSWQGAVERATFSGAWWEYEIRVAPGLTLKAKEIDGRAANSLEIGTVVFASVDPRDVRVLLDDVSTAGAPR